MTRTHNAMFFLGTLFISLFAPVMFAHAITAPPKSGVTGGGGVGVANETCKEFKGKCFYKTKCDPNGGSGIDNIGIFNKPCMDPHGVEGICIDYGVCKAQTAVTSDGGGSMNIGGLGQLLGAVSQLMGMLKGGGGGGGGGGIQGCSQYYQVSTPSSDPCAYYVPPVSGSIDTSIDTGTNTNTNNNSDSSPISDLLNSLGGNGNSSSNSNTGSQTGSSSSSGNNSSATSNANAGGVSSSTAASQQNVVQGGVQGEIRVLPNGATIVVSNQKPGSNSVVAGFLGNTIGGAAQPQGVVAAWCKTRPWATNFLSFLIPPTFFDNLCGLRGYKVGEDPAQQNPPASASQVTLTQTRVTNPAQQPAATTTTILPIVQSPPMTVDIWAVPTAVPLGGRTTIFWSSKNAASCTETSPDGSFSHSTLSGGGATVPLSGPTTFTISCMAQDGTHVTDYVTVNLSI